MTQEEYQVQVDLQKQLEIQAKDENMLVRAAALFILKHAIPLEEFRKEVENV